MIDYIRNTCSQGSRYYLRNIKYLYVIGQTLPVIDVPGPHSRKITMISKNRLKMICFRLLRREESGKILIKQMAHHFPDQNEMQLRQRLKVLFCFLYLFNVLFLLRSLWIFKEKVMIKDIGG